MPQHTIDIFAPKGGNILAGERYASIQMPVDSSRKEMLIAAEAAKAAVAQVLGRLGVHPELRYVYIPNDATEEEVAAIWARTEGSNTLPSTEEVLGDEGTPIPE